MGIIKQKARNMRYGTEIQSALTAGEHLMFQNIMSCSTNKGKSWCGAIIGLTDKRLLIEWQRKKGKNVSVPYGQIISWKISRGIGGLGDFFSKDTICVDICINEKMIIRIVGKKSVTEIFINQFKQYCIEKLD